MKIRKITILIVLVLSMLVNNLFAINFSDISANAWYGADILKLKDQGLITGYPDGTFRPASNVSKIEALKMILNAAGVVINPNSQSSYWGQEIIDTASSLGIIDATNFAKDQKITRIEFAGILVKALKIAGNLVNTSAFVDTNNKDANNLYQEGLINGVLKGALLYFNPIQEITRAELSTVMVRVYSYAANLKSGNITLKPILTVAEKYVTKNPSTIIDFEKILVFMASTDTLQMEIPYANTAFSTVSTIYANKASEAMNNVFAKYPEYFSFTNGIKINISGSNQKSTMTIRLTNDQFSSAKIKAMRSSFFLETANTLNLLIKNNKITSSMTEKEKARVIYEWVALNTAYDTKLAAESFTGYGQMLKKLAVCQGYTATYNLMCKMLGIKIEGVTGTAKSNGTSAEHMWSLAVLDGTSLYIDVTWGDPVPDRVGYCDFDYFAVTADFLRATHTWK
ncbi:MAG: S-layer homology domain-containing protein [Clostridia bacterium]